MSRTRSSGGPSSSSSSISGRSSSPSSVSSSSVTAWASMTTTFLVGVPGQRHGADAELLLDRRVKRGGVRRLGRRDRRHVGLARRSAGRPRRAATSTRSASTQHLLLLQRDARRAAAAAGLQEEGARAGLADGARHEPLGRVVLKTMRAMRRTLCGRGRRCLASRRRRRGRRRRPADASGVRTAVLRGTRKPRSLPRSLAPTTNGPQRRVGDDADRRRVDDQALELVEVHAQRVGEHRLDDVAVRHHDVDGVVAEAGVPLAHGGRPPGSACRASPRRPRPGTSSPTGATGPPSRAGPWRASSARRPVQSP